jgi:Uma2 family endonuclease
MEANPIAPPRLYTADEYWAWCLADAHHNKHTYLLAGVIHLMPPTGWLYGEVASEIGMLIRSYAKRHQLGSTTAAETGYRLSDDTVLAPGVGFISAERIPQVLPEGFVPFAPDLAVEIISPSNTLTEIRAKVEQYLQHGTRLVWVIDPRKQKVDVYRPAPDGKALVSFLGIQDMLDGEDMLIGFSVAIKDLFP